MKLVCASANPDKVAEIVEILGPVDVELLPRPDHVPDIVEDADSLVGNARLKAAAIASATGLPAVADDTGLFVDALDGAPGIYAARYAGASATYADNRAKLLDALNGRAPEERGAAFKTVAMIMWPDGREIAVEGVCLGRIVEHERGERGFGYDPVFMPLDGDGRTFAEMDLERKNDLSHRGRAFRALADALAAEQR